MSSRLDPVYRDIDERSFAELRFRGAADGAVSWRRIAVPAYGPSLVGSIGHGAVAPVLALAARDLGASVSVAALFVALAALAEFVCSVPVGLFDYLPNATIDRWVKERVLLPADFLKRYSPAERRLALLHEGAHHDHMVCMSCGRVTEFFSPEIEELQNKIAEQHNFRIREHSLYLYGECKDCACAGKSAGKSRG